MAELSQITFNDDSGVPLYRQLADSIRNLVELGTLRDGERLPATRELALQLGLNRATVSAAYNMLETSGVLQGHVGRGSFVSAGAGRKPEQTQGIDWDSILPPLEFPISGAVDITINLATSRPAAANFPVSAFKRSAREAIDSPDAAQVLQLGSPHGYAPLRRFLMNEALAAGVARAGDDLLMTNGCQQGLDLIARLFPAGQRSVALEDPVYHGLLRVFSRSGYSDIVPIPLDDCGMSLDALESALSRAHPRLVVVTPSFQNPTGATLTMERRHRLLALTQRYGAVVIENDIYSELRYVGKPLPSLKELDTAGNVILLRSYSKISFPGLRVGWVIGPKPFMARLAEMKQISDLHSDQLSQAVLLRFAQSGELAAHLAATRTMGLRRLEAALSACREYLPEGCRFNRPEGGMCLWIQMPALVNAENILSRAEKRGVSFLPGSLFSSRQTHRRNLRVSFGGMSPEEISLGIRLISEAAREEIDALAVHASREPLTAVV